MDDLLTTKQLMELLHLDRTTIYRMLNDGRLPAVRVGGQWRFSRQAIDDWLRDRKPAAAEVKVTAQTAAVAPRPNVEILPLYCLQPIQEVFALTGEIGAVTTDLNGNPLTPLSNSCAFCTLIQSTEQGRAQCQASWKKLADKSEKQPRLEQCHAGLTYARGRVVVQDTFIAMFFVGQFTVDQATQVQSPAHVATVARACGVNEKQLGEAAKDIRILPQPRAEQLLSLLQMVADTYSHIGQERLDLMNRLKQVAEIAGAAT
ncbi:MAG: PocR ligand-binding domain-containing protein [Chloroflexi bacterium]|nr:PocR ligand-binding domain-containing protein [Chloroflexota bacterium]